METKSDKFQMLPISQVVASKTNPRKHFEQGPLNELVDSIKAKGILVPLIVRNVNSHAEIVAGERRYRAAKLAGLKEIPVLIKDLTEDEALEIQVIENLQREDINPVEEAEGFKRLIDTGKWDYKTISEKIGKNIDYVITRLKVLLLIPEAQAEMQSGFLSIGHAKLLSRLQPEQQAIALFVAVTDNDYIRDGLNLKTLAKEIKAHREHKAMQVDDLKSFIQSYFEHSLSSAPWKWDDAELLPKAGACTLCPKNTACENQLFPVTGNDKKRAVCLDPGCFKEKKEKYVEKRYSELIADGTEVILVSTSYSPEHKTKEFIHDKVSHILTVIGSGDYDECKKTTKGAKLALIVSGYDKDKHGHVIYITKRKQHQSSQYSGKSKKQIDKERDAQKIKRDKKFKRIDNIVLKVSKESSLVFLRAICEVMANDYSTFGYKREKIIKILGWKPAAKGKQDLTKVALARIATADFSGLLKFIGACYLAENVRVDWSSDNIIKKLEIALKKFKLPKTKK